MTDFWDAAALSLGPVAYWPLDDDGTWADATGNGHALTESGTVATATLADGKVGASFDGTKYLYASDAAALRPETMTAGWSVSAWLERTASPGTQMGWFGKGTNVGIPDLGMWLQLWTDYSPNHCHGSGSGSGTATANPYNRDNVTSGETVGTSPVHIVWTYDYAGKVSTCYLDGVAVTTITEYGSNTNAWVWGSGTNTEPVTIGVGNPSQGGFQGKVAKVAYYDKVLTSGDATTLFEGVNLGKTGERPSGGSLREALQAVADGNAGRFFVAADGTTTLQWRDAETAKATALTLNAEQVSPWYAGITLSPGFAETVNEVVLRLADGTEVRATAAERTAVMETVSLVLDTLLTDAGEAQDLADFLAAYMSRPSRVVTEVVCKPQGWGAYDPALAVLLELGDRVSVNLPDGDTFDGTVERIAWDFDPDVTLRLGLDRYDPGGFGNADWFVLDSSALDGADVLAY